MKIPVDVNVHRSAQPFQQLRMSVYEMERERNLVTGRVAFVLEIDRMSLVGGGYRYLVIRVVLDGFEQQIMTSKLSDCLDLGIGL